MRSRLRSSGVVVALLLLMLLGSFLFAHFFTIGNLLNAARQMALVGIDMTYVILTAGIGLSVGSTPGWASFVGKHTHVVEAIHEPKSLRGGSIPVVVGGNGPKVTWRLAARYADELNLDSFTPEQVASAMPVIASRCQEIGRDPASLAVSVHLWGPTAAAAPGTERRELFARYAELGVARVIVQGFVGVNRFDLVEQLAEDCRAAGLLATSAPETPLHSRT